MTKPCKGCVKCPECTESVKIIATFTIVKDLEKDKYLEKGFRYKCNNCGHEWWEEYKD